MPGKRIRVSAIQHFFDKFKIVLVNAICILQIAEISK